MTQVNRPSGISAVTFFRLLPRALTTFSLRRDRRAALGHRHDQFAGEIFAGQRFRRGDDVVDVALRR